MRWHLFRTVEYYPFDVWSVGMGYVRGQSRALRWRFKNVLFYFDGQVDYSLRGLDDLEDLRKFLRRNFDAAFVKRVGGEIRRATGDLLLITKKAFCDRKSLARHFDEFLQMHQRFFAVFQTPELAQYLVPEKNKKLLERFGMDRDYAARQLAEVERISRSRLGKIMKLPRQTALFLVPAEVKRWLVAGCYPKDIRKRKQWVLWLQAGQEKMFYNKVARRIFYREYGQYLDKSKPRQLVGRPAYPGKVSGRVFRAMSDQDVKKAPHGAVLVCPMTRYTITSYLKRVSAIVTDHGGITCHAAVIGREFKIPTVVNTGRATEVFNTGDKVEVDAERGIVRKLDKR